MLEAQLRPGRVRAAVFVASTYFGFQPLFDVCKRAGVPALAYQTEYPVRAELDRVATGGYFDELFYLRHTLAGAAGIIGIFLVLGKRRRAAPTALHSHSELPACRSTDARWTR